MDTNAIENVVPSLRRASKRLSLLLVTAASVLLLEGMASAQGTYTQIDVPGSIETYSTGINSRGEIAGFYYDQDCGTCALGYVLYNGKFTTISYGSNVGTGLRALNDKGKIVGNTSDGLAFVYDIYDGTFSGFPCGITPNAINNAGVVVGVYQALGVGVNGSKCIYRAPKNSLGTNPEGITTDGTVVGFAQSSINRDLVSFAYKSGHFTRVLLPHPKLHLQIYGVSPSGNIIVATSANSFSSFFLDQTGRSQTLTFPGAGVTWATGVNDSGQVVGSFLGSGNIWHGFTWTPPERKQNFKAAQ